MRSCTCQPLTPLNPAYPSGLRALTRPPALLCRGELRPEDGDGVAVVGARTPSPAGIADARWLAAHLSRGGVTVISGLARGIDTTAHEACLESGGRTVAVLGCGTDRVYPPENECLAERIATRGAVLSEREPAAPPTPAALRRRNRIIAAMARAIVVIEAGEMSGARITARWALALGRPLFLGELAASQDWVLPFLDSPGVHRLELGASGQDAGLPALLLAAAMTPAEPTPNPDRQGRPRGIGAGAIQLCLPVRRDG